jgi:hypothetical protein
MGKQVNDFDEHFTLFTCALGATSIECASSKSPDIHRFFSMIHIKDPSIPRRFPGSALASSLNSLPDSWIMLISLDLFQQNIIALGATPFQRITAREELEIPTRMVAENETLI